MTKVTLIHPSNRFLSSPTMYFSLGLLYIAAVLEEAGHKVQIADLRAKNKYVPKAKFYGITATSSPEITHAKKIVRHIKNRDSNAITIIGGSHATLFPQECLASFDVVVVGDGEKAILDIVDGGKRGIVQGEFLKDLDSIPFPARHLLPEEALFSDRLHVGEKYGRGPKATTVFSSRGCPYGCAFCSEPRKIRFRKPKCFVSEIKYLQDRHDCHYFRIIDDSFTINKKRLFEICNLLEPLHVHYHTQTRSDLLNDKMCEALRRSGCEELGLGVESADDTVLKLINKGETVKEQKRAIKMIKKAGMRVKANWLVGLPGETWETIEKNKAFMRETKPDRWILNRFCPFPGCDIEKNPSKYGVKILNRNYSLYFYFSKSFIETNVASNQELNAHFTEFNKFLRSGTWRK